MSALQPVDGCAVVLHLIEAARAWARTAGPVGPGGTALAAWVAELEDRFETETHGDAPVGWEPRRWRELMAGDKIEVGGQVAEIETAYLGDWHVDPEKWAWHPGPNDPENSDSCRACGGRCRQTRGRKYEAAEQRYMRLMLVGRRNQDPKSDDGSYRMFNLDGEVETLRGPAGQAADRLSGHRSLAPGGVEPAQILDGWVEDAAATLAAAGLGPIEVLKS